MNDIAILAYRPLKKKRANDSFDGNDNIGALVVQDILQRAGHKISFCSPATAKDYRAVLVSLTSTYDVYSFYRQVAKRPDWQPKRRSFKVVAGGFGMQNPYPIRRYLDYALFGRAETDLVGLVAAALDGRPYIGAAVMNLPEVTPVTIAQAGSLYDGEVEFRAGRTFREAFVGCANKCKFCHYTWARKHIGNSAEYFNITLAGLASREMTWKSMLRIEDKVGRIRTAIDGFSERLRYLFGKRISNAEIVEGIERLGSFAGKTVAIVYNIANFPTETDCDRSELYDVISRARPINRVIFVLHSTPFRPSLVTPMQWEGVHLSPAWHKFGAKVIYDSATLRCVHSTGNESPYSHLISIIAERATEQTDKLFHAICFHPKLQSGTVARRAELLCRNFNIDPYLREYEIGDPEFPGWFVAGYAKQSGTMAIARAMRAKY